MDKKKVLFVQIEQFHSEVLGPQFELLEEAYSLYSFASSEINSSDFVSTYRVKTKDALFFNCSPGWMFWSRWKLSSAFIYVLNILMIRLLIWREKIDLVVFNTIPTPPKVRLVGRLLKKVSKVVIVHNGENFLNHQMDYCSFEKVFFLSKEVKEHCLSFTEKCYQQKLDYFVPIFFDKFLRERPITRGREEKIILGIVGKTDETKRNYRGLIEALEKVNPEDARFKILISGEVTAGFFEEINKHQLENLVTYEKGFKSFDRMFGDVLQSDILLFLIDQEVDFCDNYNRVKISGTSNLAKAFRKPVAYSEDFKIGRFLSRYSIKYDQIGQFLSDIQTGRYTKQHIQDLVDQTGYQEYAKEEKTRYVKLINELV